VSAARVRQKYMAYREDEKTPQYAGWKTKAVSDRRQKQCITNDIEAVIKCADECADKAEKLHYLTYTTKSNSLRLAAVSQEQRCRIEV